MLGVECFAARGTGVLQKTDSLMRKRHPVVSNMNLNKLITNLSEKTVYILMWKLQSHGLTLHSTKYKIKFKFAKKHKKTKNQQKALLSN